MAPSTRWFRSRWMLAVLGVVAVAAVAAVVLVAGSTTDDDEPVHRADGPSAAGIQQARLVPIVRDLASSNGEPHPRSATVVRASSGRALLLTSSATSSEPERPVDLVVVRGNFVGYGTRRPAGSKLPRGSVMTITVDAGKGEIVGYSIGGPVPDLRELGDPVDLDLGN